MEVNSYFRSEIDFCCVSSNGESGKCVKINYCLLENVLKGGQMEIKLD